MIELQGWAPRCTHDSIFSWGMLLAPQEEKIHSEPCKGDNVPVKLEFLSWRWGREGRGCWSAWRQMDRVVWGILLIRSLWFQKGRPPAPNPGRFLYHVVDKVIEEKEVEQRCWVIFSQPCPVELALPPPPRRVPKITASCFPKIAQRCIPPERGTHKPQK